MNKQGFTLVELIIVVGLLALLGASIGITLNQTIKRQQERNYEEYIKKVISAANLYASNNKDILDSLYNDKGFVLVKAQDIINAGLLSENTINPNTKEKIGASEQIKISLDTSGTISVEYPYVEEDYLQALDIIVEYNSTPEEYCYKGINTINLGYISKSGDLDRTYLVKDSTITCTEPNIDTKKLGTYEIRYEYKLKGTSTWKSKVRNVIVVDNVAPICENKVENTSWKNVAVTVSVECKDNYGCANSKEQITLKDTEKTSIEIKDVSGNQASCELNVYSDTVTPTANIVAKKNGSDTTVLSNTWSDTGLNFTLTAGTTGPSGYIIKYCKDTTDTCNPYIVATSGTEITSYNTTIGTYYIRYQIISGAGSASNVESFVAKVDTCSFDTTTSYGDWSDWSECTKTCGTGTQIRTRDKTVKSKYGQFICSENIEEETQNCNTNACVSPTDPDLNCEISFDYLKPTGNGPITAYGNTYYEYEVTTKNEALAARQWATFDSKSLTDYYKPGTTNWLMKVKGQYSDYVQWYKDMSGRYFAGQYCKATVTKTIKTSNPGSCYMNSRGGTQDVRTDVNLNNYTGWTVNVIDFGDGWFYSPYTGDSGKTCFLKRESFSN